MFKVYIWFVSQFSPLCKFCYLECPNYLGRLFKIKNSMKCQTCKNPSGLSKNHNKEMDYYTFRNNICYDSWGEIPFSEGKIYYHNYDNIFHYYIFHSEINL